MNFVCGENGSGKTAVLHGLQTCLGVSAKQSGRASSAAALIKDGANHSRAAATLWNTGHDAFLPKKFGSEVTIVREMKRTATGATSSWAILDERGKKARLPGTLCLGWQSTVYTVPAACAEACPVRRSPVRRQRWMSC